jgi:hypothetical protein
MKELLGQLTNNEVVFVISCNSGYHIGSGSAGLFQNLGVTAVSSDDQDFQFPGYLLAGRFIFLYDAHAMFALTETFG